MGAFAQAADTDRDGIPDKQEQLLLEKFRPTFMISSNDCALRPSRFAAGESDPRAVSPDGSIYGQVLPLSKGTVEIHYYTLWDQDCGRIQHPLDVEHVAVLISIAPDTEPKALYWYAGAHEKTACDISSGGRAAALDAETRGAKVWSSSGKHALFLKKTMCGAGCGADTCDDSIELARSGEVINLGELNAPMNGSSWLASKQWVLADRMDSDFSAEVMARIDAVAADSLVTLRGRSTIRGTIRGSDLVLNSASTGAQHTEAALDTSHAHTSRSLGKATRATGKALARSFRAVFKSGEKQKQ